LAAPPRFHSAVVAALRQAAYERDRGRIASPPLRVLKPAVAIAGVALAVAATSFFVARGRPHARPVPVVGARPSLAAPNAPVTGEPDRWSPPTAAVAELPAPVSAPEPRVVHASSEPVVAAASRTRLRARQGGQAIAAQGTAKGAAGKAGVAKASSRDVTFAACLLGSIVVSEVVQPAAVQPEVQDPDFQRELVLTAWPPRPDVAPAASGAPQLAELTSRSFN
jgi:hypothetical protein